MKQNDLKKFVELVTTHNLNEAGKDEFHSRAKSVVRAVAKAMGLPGGSFDIRSNKAGDAVCGEVTLHGEHIYIQFGEGMNFGDGKKKFMFRHCEHRKDYSGGSNRWMNYEHLLDFDAAVSEFKKAEQNQY